MRCLREQRGFRQFLENWRPDHASKLHTLDRNLRLCSARTWLVSAMQAVAAALQDSPCIENMPQRYLLTCPRPCSYHEINFTLISHGNPTTHALICDACRALAPCRTKAMIKQILASPIFKIVLSSATLTQQTPSSELENSTPLPRLVLSLIWLG